MKTPVRVLCGLLLCLAWTGCRAPNGPGARPQIGLSEVQIRDVLNRVANHQIHPLKDGDYAAAKTVAETGAGRAPEGIQWNYPWGVTLYGLMRAGDATGNRAAEEFVQKHNAICARYYSWLAAERRKWTGNGSELPASLMANPISDLLKLGSLDSCGAMGAQFLENLLRHPESVTPEDKAVVERIADWIVHRQDRLPDGTLWREQQMGGTLWPDDLYMSCPFLVRWAKFTGDNRHLDDAARQIIQQAPLGMDADGLWFHGYFVNQKRPVPFKWGRGNGWAMVATVEVLSAMPDNHPLRPRLIGILRKHIEAIKPLQTENGMWRQLLDQPPLWEETSCTAMFAYSIARAVNRGWIDPSYMNMARRAFAGISKNITPDGAVNGTCEGTNIGQTLEYYVNRKRPANDSHGIGPVLLAGAELLSAPQPR